jgi:hypothetical protein
MKRSCARVCKNALAFSMELAVKTGPVMNQRRKARSNLVMRRANEKLPNCSTLMEVVDVSGLPEQPADDSKIPGVPRVRSACPNCHHLEGGYPKGRNLQHA